MATTVAQPVFKPKIDFAVQHDTLEERATIVHCTVSTLSLVRIWPTTFLVQDDGVRKALLQAYHITRYPDWKWLLPGQAFTLVFEGLDKRCLLFDLLEDIPEPGGFHIANIERNRTDVYQVTVD